MEDSSGALREQIMQVVENQLVENDPPEVQETLDRLKAKGHSEEDAKNLIGQCVGVELFEVLQSQKPFNRERYIKNLHNLPERPYDSAQE